ncbi:MAG TPA: heme o synthase [Acidobacteriaceae bacterium]
MVPLAQAARVPVAADPVTADEATADKAAVTAPKGELAPGATASRLADYAELFKLRVTANIVLTAWAGFYLGSLRTGISSMQPGLIAVLLGIGLVAAGSAAMNEAIERKLDFKMLRTARRPMAAGRIGMIHGLTVSLGTMVLGTIFLMHAANLLTGLLTLGTAFTYIAIYTPLKRYTTLATFIGAFPGAMPPLLGWVAARGSIEWAAVALFALLFVWQFPHFMAIAWLYREDYARAGIRMLPVVQPDGWSTVVEAISYAVLMVPVSLLPVYLHLAGYWYGGVALALGLVYLGYTIRFSRITRARSTVESKMYARDLLKVSVIYLPLLLLTLMLNATGK